MVRLVFNEYYFEYATEAIAGRDESMLDALCRIGQLRYL